MTLEILEGGGARITATERELRTLVHNTEAAVLAGSSRAPFLTDEGVTEFVIEVEGQQADA
jgi:hypothetical protein